MDISGVVGQTEYERTNFMCFSAPASFIAGTPLTAIGVAALRKTEARSEIPFAMIPLLSGIQQLIEGVIWLTFSNDAPMLKQTMTYVYSGFSHVLWPICVPFAMGLMEAVQWRRKVFLAFGVVGVAVGLYLLYYIVVTRWSPKSSAAISFMIRRIST